jgi:hypothetical protein
MLEPAQILLGMTRRCDFICMIDLEQRVTAILTVVDQLVSPVWRFLIKQRISSTYLCMLT